MIFLSQLKAPSNGTETGAEAAATQDSDEAFKVPGAPAPTKSKAPPPGFKEPQKVSKSKAPPPGYKPKSAPPPGYKAPSSEETEPPEKKAKGISS